MKIKSPIKHGAVDICARHTMYPSFALMLWDHKVSMGPAENICCSTLYGYSFGSTKLSVDGLSFHLRPKEYISLPINNTLQIEAEGKFFGAFRLGYRGQQIQGKAEEKGRLSYIDGCSDTLLVYPPRLGDPSLNFLYFPPHIDQTFHTHPSIRLGCVSEGSGFACLRSGVGEDELQLEEGTFFMLEEQEMHRFKTKDRAMKVVPYHPDGDWGPTDHNHTMLNRTYLANQ